MLKESSSSGKSYKYYLLQTLEVIAKLYALQPDNPVYTKLLMTFCFLSMLSPTIPSNFQSYGLGPWESYLCYAIRYSNLYFVFTDLADLPFYYILAICIVFHFTIIVCYILVIMYTIKHSQENSDLNWICIPLAIFQQAFIWVFVLPDMIIYYYCIMSKTSIPGYFIGALLSLMMPIVYTYMVEIGTFEVDFLGQHSMSHRLTSVTKQLVFGKIVIGLSVCLANSSEVWYIPQIFNMIVSIGLLWMYFLELPFNKQSISKFYGYLLFNYVSWSLLFLMRFQLNVDIALGFDLVIASVSLYYINKQIRSMLKITILLHQNSGELSDHYFDYAMRKLVTYLNCSFEKKKKATFYLLLFIVNHNRYCRTPSCSCKTFKPKSLSEITNHDFYEESVTILMYKEGILKIIDDSFKQMLSLKRRSTRIELEIIHILFMFQNFSNTLEIYLCLSQLKENYKAIPSKERNAIGLVLIELELKISSKNVNKQHIYLRDVLEFYKILANMKKKMVSALTDNISFLQEIITPVMNLDKASNLSRNFIRDNEAVAKYIERLVTQFPYHPEVLRVLQAYGALQFIEESQMKQFDVVAKLAADVVLKSEDAVEHVSVYNPRSCIIFVSLNERHLGQIRKASLNLTTLFGYEPEEFSYLDVNTLMPSIFAEKHNQYLSQCVQKSSKLNKFISDTYGVTKDNFLFPTKVYVKYEICEEELCVAACISKAPQESEVIMVNDRGYIINYSRGLYKDMGFEKLGEVMEKGTFNIGLLCPRLLASVMEHSSEFEGLAHLFRRTVTEAGMEVGKFDENNILENEKLYFILPKTKDFLKQARIDWRGNSIIGGAKELIDDRNRVLLRALHQCYENYNENLVCLYTAYTTLRRISYKDGEITADIIELSTIKEMHDVQKKRETIKTCLSFIQSLTRNYTTLLESKVSPMMASSLLESTRRNISYKKRLTVDSPMQINQNMIQKSQVHYRKRNDRRFDTSHLHLLRKFRGEQKANSRGPSSEDDDEAPDEQGISRPPLTDLQNRKISIFGIRSRITKKMSSIEEIVSLDSLDTKERRRRNSTHINRENYIDDSIATDRENNAGDTHRSASQDSDDSDKRVSLLMSKYNELYQSQDFSKKREALNSREPIHISNLLNRGLFDHGPAFTKLRLDKFKQELANPNNSIDPFYGGHQYRDHHLPYFGTAENISTINFPEMTNSDQIGGFTYTREDDNHLLDRSHDYKIPMYKSEDDNNEITSTKFGLVSSKFKQKEATPKNSGFSKFQPLIKRGNSKVFKASDTLSESVEGSKIPSLKKLTTPSLSRFRSNDIFLQRDYSTDFNSNFKLPASLRFKLPARSGDGREQPEEDDLEKKGLKYAQSLSRNFKFTYHDSSKYRKKRTLNNIVKKFVVEESESISMSYHESEKVEDEEIVKENNNINVAMFASNLDPENRNEISSVSSTSMASVLAMKKLYRNLLSHSTSTATIAKLNIFGLLLLSVLLTVIILLFVLVFPNLVTYGVYVENGDFSCKLLSATGIYTAQIDTFGLIVDGFFNSSVNTSALTADSYNLMDFALEIFSTTYENSVINSDLQGTAVSFDFHKYTLNLYELADYFNETEYEYPYTFAQALIWNAMNTIRQITIDNYLTEDPTVYLLRRNFPILMQTTFLISDGVNSEVYGADSKIDIKKFAYDMLYLSICITFALLLTIYPIYRRIEISKEKGLSLLGTYPEQEILTRIAELKVCRAIIEGSSTEEIADVMEHHHHKHSKSINDNKSRKRKFRSWNKRKTSPILFIIVLFLVFAVISVYFVVNVTRIVNHNSNFLSLYEEFDSTSKMYAMYDSYYWIAMEAMNYYNYTGPYWTNFFTICDPIYASYHEQLNITCSFIENIDTLLETNSDATDAYREMETYIKDSDVCLFIDPSQITDLQKTQCQLALNGVSRLGLPAFLKAVFSYSDEIYYMMNLTNFDNGTIETFTNDPSFVEWRSMLYYGDRIFWKYINGMRTNLNTVLNNQIVEEIVFLVVGIVLMIGGFLFGMRPFLHSMTNQLTNVKKILGTLPIELIVSNPYVKKWLKENSDDND